MDHNDHVALLRDGIPAEPGPVWADFGCGAGAFTLALADLLPDGTVIYGIDRDARALDRLRERIGRFDVDLHTVQADFTQPIPDLPPLDGLCMANALHFHRKRRAIVERVAGYLKSDAPFLIVEYNISMSRPWVPHPVPFERWQRLVEKVGLVDVRLIGRRPSRTTREIYAAVALSS